MSSFKTFVKANCIALLKCPKFCLVPHVLFNTHYKSCFLLKSRNCHIKQNQLFFIIDILAIFPLAQCMVVCTTCVNNHKMFTTFQNAFWDTWSPLNRL